MLSAIFGFEYLDMKQESDSESPVEVDNNPAEVDINMVVNPSSEL